MFKILNLSNIFYWIEKLIGFINSIFFILLLVALSFALIFSPPDYLQGDSVRIMYVHVPSAWIGLASFSSIAILSIAHFIFKIKNIKLITKSIAPIGLMFTCLALVTGSIWGQPTWGTWWAWDARITSMLILALFYIGFKYSVDWWNTLHQPASIKLTGESSIHSSMLMPLLLMFFVLILYCALIFLMKYKTEIIRIKKKNLKRL